MVPGLQVKSNFSRFFSPLLALNRTSTVANRATEVLPYPSYNGSVDDGPAAASTESCSALESFRKASGAFLDQEDAAVAFLRGRKVPPAAIAKIRTIYAKLRSSTGSLEGAAARQIPAAVTGGNMGTVYEEVSEAATRSSHAGTIKTLIKYGGEAGEVIDYASLPPHVAEITGAEILCAASEAGADALEAAELVVEILAEIAGVLGMVGGVLGAIEVSAEIKALREERQEHKGHLKTIEQGKSMVSPAVAAAIEQSEKQQIDYNSKRMAAQAVLLASNALGIAGGALTAIGVHAAAIPIEVASWSVKGGGKGLDRFYKAKQSNSKGESGSELAKTLNAAVSTAGSSRDMNAIRLLDEVSRSAQVREATAKLYSELDKILWRSITADRTPDEQAMMEKINRHLDRLGGDMLDSILGRGTTLAATSKGLLKQVFFAEFVGSGSKQSGDLLAGKPADIYARLYDRLIQIPKVREYAKSEEFKQEVRRKVRKDRLEMMKWEQMPTAIRADPDLIEKRRAAKALIDHVKGSYRNAKINAYDRLLKAFAHTGRPDDFGPIEARAPSDRSA
ncbi:hypothetical protein [Chelativorans sp. Marseille-P2723]|uniref:hypothetical protein n=1 Tax=Chelativorans sp. Marseille-P2723 TaxID=2709133 RepID=UPI00156DD7AA|nr:hypothetical protein [Chelativorans sp. Marseille-P2723]